MTTDQTHDDWKPLDWNASPARIGDEVEITDKFCGVTYVKSGVIVSFNCYDDPCAATDGRGEIGVRGQGTWRVRRKRLDPLADLTPGTILRDVTIVGHGSVCGGFILADARGHVVATTHGYYFLSWITAFTTDDRTIRYIRHGDTWTAENLNGETND